MIHAENGDIINFLTDQLERAGMVSPEFHATARPMVVEAEATSRAIVLSELMDCPILFVHVSAPDAAAKIREAQSKDLKVYAETCPQYLFLLEADLAHAHPSFEGAKCVCSPPPRPSKEDHEKIWAAMRNGTFTVFSSDHSPFSYDDPHGKKLGITLGGGGPVGKFRYIPNGCPGIETRLPLLFTRGIEEGRLSPQKFVELTSTNPAKLYGIYPQKGSIIPGISDADLTIWYPPDKMTPFKLTNSMLHHDTDYTPYEGFEFANWPRYTISKGKTVWKEGKLLGKAGDGSYLMRKPSIMAKPRRIYNTGKWNVDMKSASPF